MEYWKCTCPKCFFTNYATNFNDAITHDNHKPGCAFYERGIETRFDAKPVRGLEKIMAVIKCR